MHEERHRDHSPQLFASLGVHEVAVDLIEETLRERLVLLIEDQYTVGMIGTVAHVAMDTLEQVRKVLA